jgi:hypothetical protein
MPVLLQVLLYVLAIYGTGYIACFLWLAFREDHAYKHANPVPWSSVAALLWQFVVMGVTALVTIILVGTGVLGTGWLWLAIAGLVLGDVTLTFEPPPGRRRR